MAALSRTVILNASPKNYNLCVAKNSEFYDNNSMDSENSQEDKNGGPNNLRAWRLYEKMTQAELAEAVGTTQNQIAFLETNERSLSAKWLRRLAVPLKITPGFLLDHNPNNLPPDIIDIWARADDRQRQQIAAVAEAIVKTGTNG